MDPKKAKTLLDYVTSPNFKSTGANLGLHGEKFMGGDAGGPGGAAKAGASDTLARTNRALDQRNQVMDIYNKALASTKLDTLTKSLLNKKKPKPAPFTFNKENQEI